MRQYKHAMFVEGGKGERIEREQQRGSEGRRDGAK
jgi:hypothetical protein